MREYRSRFGSTQQSDESAAESESADTRIRLALRRRIIQRKAARAQADASAATQEAARSEPEEAPRAEGSDATHALPEKVRVDLEAKLGADLSGVTIHMGPQADRMARRLGARAFTQGKDVFFAEGEYAPDSPKGLELLAHELTHVVQQGAAPKKTVGGQAEAPKETPPVDAGADTDASDAAQPKLNVSAPSDPAEREADAIASRVIQGGAAHPEHAAHADVHRSVAAAAAHDLTVGAPDAAGPAAKPVEPPRPGATGILAAEAQVKLPAGDAKLGAGTVVEVVSVSGDKLKVKVYSGHDGADAEIPLATFQAQPGVALDSHTQKPRQDVYADFGDAALWGPDGPKPEDVKQGAIGDCYLIAAMGAVCAANPSAIKQIISPQTSGAKAYGIVLHKPDPTTGKLSPVTITVDPMLPSLKAATPAAAVDPELAYAGAGQTEATAKLWPSLIEKAYAILVGSYKDAGQGGVPTNAMSALTGLEGQSDAVPAKDDVISEFKEHQAAGHAVVCGTLGQMSHKAANVFTGTGDMVSGTLTTHEGEPCQVVPSSLELREDKSKTPFYAGDDGKGKLVSPSLESGQITYHDGSVSMKFKDQKRPSKSEDITAEYDFRGLISKEYDLFAWHAYIFERIEGETLIFKNPWGSRHPKPIPAAAFAKLFNRIYSGQVPKPEDPPPGT